LIGNNLFRGNSRGADHLIYVTWAHRIYRGAEPYYSKGKISRLHRGMVVGGGRPAQAHIYWPLFRERAHRPSPIIALIIKVGSQLDPSLIPTHCQPFRIVGGPIEL
jgi:hypothetical protein